MFTGHEHTFNEEGGGWRRVNPSKHRMKLQKSQRSAPRCEKIQHKDAPASFALGLFSFWICLRLTGVDNASEQKKGVRERRGGSTTLEHLILVGALSRASRLLKSCLKPCLATETLLPPGPARSVWEPGIWHQTPIKRSLVILPPHPASEGQTCAHTKHQRTEIPSLALLLPPPRGSC